MTSRSEESTAMTTVDCPWCQASAEITASAFECAECGITAPVAGEDEALPLAA